MTQTQTQAARRQQVQAKLEAKKGGPAPVVEAPAPDARGQGRLITEDLEARAKVALQNYQALPLLHTQYTRKIAQVLAEVANVKIPTY